MPNSAHLMGKEAPILFCHYGNSRYLKYTLKAARLFNPCKRIVLLGDSKNRDVAMRSGIEHFFFSNYDNSKEIVTFDKVYKHVAGTKHTNEAWTKFVFKRWFFVHCFLRKEGIHRFWHFDSDNLILRDLRQQESKFESYDCTEQCEGKCMNGFVSSRDVVDGYVQTINALFQDEEYLDEQRRDFEIYPHYGFTEMRAYLAYKLRANVKSVRLNTIIGGESFDDCICLSQGFRTYDKPLRDRYLKKVFYSRNGRLFCQVSETGEFVRMNSFNMSWVPDYLFEIILDKANPDTAEQLSGVDDDLSLLDVHSISLVHRATDISIRIRNRIRRFGSESFRSPPP